jgi:hypothetical protein
MALRTFSFEFSANHKRAALFRAEAASPGDAAKILSAHPKIDAAAEESASVESSLHLAEKCMHPKKFSCSFKNSACSFCKAAKLQDARSGILQRRQNHENFGCKAAKMQRCTSVELPHNAKKI